MTFLIIFLCIAGLVLMITWGKINPFLAFLIVSIAAGLLLGIPFNKVIASVQFGIGDTLGSLVIIIALGAMLGKLVADSGAAQKIASVMMKAFGVKYIQWALVVTGFIIGIPLFYGVGFVLMIPLIFSVVYQYKLPAVYIGLPMLAALSVTFGFLPPHPSPTALVVQFHANMGLTLIYGLIIAIPAIIIAGPLFSRTLKNIHSVPLETFHGTSLPEDRLPGTVSSFLSALLPVVLLMIATLVANFVSPATSFGKVVSFLAEPAVVMLISLSVATYTLGIKQGSSIKSVMSTYAESVKDIAMILLIIGSSGALKQVLTDSGISQEIAAQLNHVNIHPLILAWLIAAIIRICVGSATVAGLTTAGILAPLILQGHVNPNLMVLSIGAGSLAFSHVNDSGFWMFKEYFNVSIKDTIRSWTMMETIISLVGLAGVLILNIFV
ncbi:gluconate transporter [Ginsengibacter hankyongi]|uniref:Gluconate transporter n=1 Tax=Ginsengibacter hankyongi TaxID=2607284 RepID=A0A5J5IN88_9BACT|nr:gluconate:H+ symporter [Ginsengibacter hankyongi]KAA9040972.1 gluconate transporter [Ginsengibacter hankyongi]